LLNWLYELLNLSEVEVEPIFIKVVYHVQLVVLEFLHVFELARIFCDKLRPGLIYELLMLFKGKCVL